MLNLNQLQTLLEHPRNILITSHANPDGDAIGSALSLFHYLVKKGHKVNVVMPTEMPDFFDFMSGFDNIWIFEKQHDSCMRLIENAEIIFALDFNHFNRTEQMEKPLSAAKAYKVMIDHHLEPDNFADAILWKTAASSTCELIYDFFELNDALDIVPIESFECLYVGILTDTGGFQHATNPRIFRISADLCERGVNINHINNMVSNSYSYKRFRLFAYSINERMELLEEVNTGIIILNQEDHRIFNIQRGDLEGIVNFILRIRQLRCAILVTERKDRVKLSFRSKGNFSVQEICSKYFNGGGHFNASGGQTKDSLEKTMELLKKLLYNEYKEALTAF